MYVAATSLTIIALSLALVCLLYGYNLLKCKVLMLTNCGVGEDSWESLGLQGDPTSPFWRRSALGVLWKEWCWRWNSSTLATSCEELTHWKRLWCWERLGEGGKGEYRGWDGWMASPTWWTWVWVNSGRWWWTGSPGMLRFMGLQRVGHNWATELNGGELNGMNWRGVLRNISSWNTHSSLCFCSIFSVMSNNPCLLNCK